MPNQHKWFTFKHNWSNSDKETRRCVYCDVRWHPSRELVECPAEFPTPEDKNN